MLLSLITCDYEQLILIGPMWI